MPEGLSNKNLKDELVAEVLKARTRVYHIGAPTPLEKLPLENIKGEVWVKREDLSLIHAYKWRGAYNATLSHLEKPNAVRVIVAASAGNHAQGIALSAKKLNITAHIFMPLSTPQMKQNAVKFHGQDNVQIHLVGDNYDVASAAAKEFASQNNYAYIHPFDSVETIAGQATIADEIILSNQNPFDVIFIPIGGGGMAAGIANWIKLHNPETRIIGVEGAQQASMHAAFKNNAPVTLETVDGFCDGTAVKRVGDVTYALCKNVIDGFMLVSNDEVSAAIQTYWEALRVIPEPSGAMALAAYLKMAREKPEAVELKKSLVICCGANMDFGKLASLSRQSAIGAHRRRYVRIEIEEQNGSLLNLLETYFADVNVAEFQYGKTYAQKGYPVIAFEGDEKKLEKLFEKLNADKIIATDVTHDEDVRYRIINYNPNLFHLPLFLSVDFPERRGALRDFMRLVSRHANLVYFNYAYSGEQIGKAIMGFEFENLDTRQGFLKLLEDYKIVTVKALPENVQARLVAG